MNVKEDRHMKENNPESERGGKKNGLDRKGKKTILNPSPVTTPAVSFIHEMRVRMKM